MGLPVLVVVVVALGAVTPMRLRYDVVGTECPDSAALDAAVSARLGRAAFASEGADAIEVKVKATGRGLEARVVKHVGGAEVGVRELASPALDCVELFRALELAVALAVESSGSRAAPAAAPAPVAPASPNPTEVPWRFFGGPAVMGVLGSGVGPTGGAGLSLGVQRGRFELGLGGRVELPSTRAVPNGTLSTQASLGELAGCVALGGARACGLFSLGALRVTSDGLTRPTLEVTVLAALGARLAWEVRLSERIRLRPWLDVSGQLAGTVVTSGGEVVWSSSPVLGAVGLAVLFSS